MPHGEHRQYHAALTNDADLPQPDKGGLDLLDVRQASVQVGLENVAALGMALGDGATNPVNRSQQE